MRGAEDVLVSASQHLSATGDAGGEVNRVWCDMLHRGQDGQVEPAPRVIVPDAHDYYG